MPQVLTHLVITSNQECCILTSQKLVFSTKAPRCCNFTKCQPSAFQVMMSARIFVSNMIVISLLDRLKITINCHWNACFCHNEERKSHFLPAQIWLLTYRDIRPYLFCTKYSKGETIFTFPILSWRIHNLYLPICMYVLVSHWVGTVCRGYLEILCSVHTTVGWHSLVDIDNPLGT